METTVLNPHADPVAAFFDRPYRSMWCHKLDAKAPLYSVDLFGAFGAQASGYGPTPEAAMAAAEAEYARRYPSDEAMKAERVAKLRDELAKLGEAA